MQYSVNEAVQCIPEVGLIAHDLLTPSININWYIQPRSRVLLVQPSTHLPVSPQIGEQP